MGKSTRKAKAKKKDFNKVKLKVGKRKPLASNATQTSFKSQSIYIAEQLKTKARDEVVTHNNQSISDLLSHLNHFNATFRYRSLNGIKEILLAQKDNLANDAARVIEKVSKSIVDDDSEVRKACLSVLQVIFNGMPEIKISPYFALVISHLYCAMSHLSSDVQKDSLKVVDLCIKYYPNLLRKHADFKLVQHFIDFITIKERGSVIGGPILSMKLSKNETAVMWRIRVLSRLHALLEMLVEEEKITKNDEKVLPWNSRDIGLLLMPEPKRDQGILLKNLKLLNIIKTPQKTELELMEMIIPILIQCWLEVCGGGIFNKDAETVTTMIHVVAITLKLCENLLQNADDKIAAANWLKTSYLNLVCKHFFNNFPFEQPDTVDEMPKLKNKKKSKKNVNVKVVEVQDIETVNLLICNVMPLLLMSDFEISDQEKIDTVASYLATLLNCKCEASLVLDASSLGHIMGCIRKLMKIKTNRENNNELMSSLYLYCCTLRKSHPQRAIIIGFILEYFEKIDTSQINSSFDDLVCGLPTHLSSLLCEICKHKCQGCKLESADILMENINSVIRCMHGAVKQKNQSFLSIMADSFCKILTLLDEKASQIFCHVKLHCGKCFALQKSLLECLVANVPRLTKSEFTALANITRSDYVSETITCHITDLLMQRVDPLLESSVKDDGKDEIILFIKFLFSALLGTKKDQLDDKPISTEIMQRHITISEHICKKLEKFWADDVSFVSETHKFMENICANISWKEKETVGILKLQKHLLDQNSFPIVKKCGQLNESDLWKCCIDVLQSSSAVTRDCVCCITKSDCIENIDSLVCLLRHTEMQEKLLHSSDVVSNYIREIDDAGGTAASSESFRKLKTLSEIIMLP